ncbi:MAG: hypothetical protein KC431_22860, partial [Myxococcales bacterium]|nr:hypothetical protein [Myxococcales bacterium]
MGSSIRRGSRSGRKSRSKQAKPNSSAADAVRVLQDPRYGPIPLLLRTWTDRDGTPRASYEMDPDYQPPLPPG